MNKIVNFFLILVLLPTFFCYAGNSSLSIDIVSYKNLIDDKGSYTELYYSIPYPRLKFTETENIMTATYELSLVVRDKSGNKIISEKTNQGIQTAATDFKNRENLKITDIHKFYIHPGFYTFEFELSGDGLNSDLYYEGEFVAPDYSGSDLQLSQIEICSNISTDTKVEKYVKNNLMVYPNPSKVFDLTKAVIFFYAELYNLQYNQTDSLQQEYTLSYYILNIKGDTVKTYPILKNKKGGTTAVVANLINLRKYETGLYTLVLNAEDESTLQSTQQKVTFNLENIPYITEEYAETFRNMVNYFASESELEVFDRLNLIGKQSFIEQFWKRRDPSPETFENEFKQVYFQRWDFVNVRYANESGNQEGWKTDRGRIYLKHGAPTDIERVVGDIKFRDHEIWYYEGERYGTKKFVFADIRMRGSYNLIHSESPNQEEVYNSNWRASISTR